jgi:hypothetical protein
MSAMPAQQRHHPRRGIDWDIFEARSSKGSRIEIEKCDDSSYFASDDDAVAWVLQHACDPATEEAIRTECQTALRQLVDSWTEETSAHCRLR